ncbi:hypothetical protein CONPUDRAFT_67020 [Coniophora puteana RWD-64-598 SS2]|uniref:IRG-type G domain-containing protein n=1 Tax=Coniophora puteana (strain RWD-64-598) TaxID=741705 RepID=R7SFH4_CONPW|nr:uncharacterized protein CONPUDRAFT_67020 [Coniophora puteana RWD-64-598 SS2]EIW74625.1 hypothetical protein CONPUDRAFT_67020 [Coniophora puteana RWD-64-598 SS2]
MPSTADLEDTKRRIKYGEGVYHFAVAGTASSKKTSLINALRGLRNRDDGATSATGIKTTLRETQFPDSDPRNPFVWYDIPDAATLQVRDWQYFNDQGLYVFDALIVLIDNCFTKTDIAVIRNASLFNIPCYIVHSEADQRIREIMSDNGYDSDSEAKTLSTLERAARDQFVTAMRESTQENLRAAGLPEQRVYIVSSLTLLSAITGNVTSTEMGEMIDEFDFLTELFSKAQERRPGGKTDSKGSF